MAKFELLQHGEDEGALYPIIGYFKINLDEKSLAWAHSIPSQNKITLSKIYWPLISFVYLGLMIFGICASSRRLIL
jgi:hypothetical protein